jgi:putative endonuclease
MRQYWVYILASKRNGTLYTGVTSNLETRIYRHKHDLIKGFTKRYGVHRLVWFETHADIREAIAREKTD